MERSTGELSTTRDADAEGGPTNRLLEALEGVRRERGEMISATKLLAALQGRPGCEPVRNTKRLASVMHPLGFARQQVWNGGHRCWCWTSAASPTFARAMAADRPRSAFPGRNLGDVDLNPSSTPVT